MKDEKSYIQHILDSIQKMEAYACGVDKEKFLKESMIQDALIRDVGIIGEAVKLISNEAKMPVYLGRILQE